MAEKDFFKELVNNLGEPENARKLSMQEANRYKNRVPDMLINFWIKHGWGSYMQGFFWFCDPILFDPLLSSIFDGDPEFHAENISVVGYTADSDSLLMWHQDGYRISAFPNDSEMSIGYKTPQVDAETGSRYSDSFLVGAFLTAFLQYDTDDFDELTMRLGRIAEGEVYGYVPARQLGGSHADRERVRAAEYFDFIAQLKPYELVELTPTEPGYPFGRHRTRRQIGRQP